MQAPQVRVTVGIPTFNRAHLLRESIASVLAQSYREFRLIVSDNASEDNTEQVVKSFTDTRIDYVRSDENIGLVGNFNRVIELADTEFLLLLPDDDVLYPDHLRSTIEVFERHPNLGVVHSAFDMIDASSCVIEHDRSVVDVDGPYEVESGDAYIERSMQSPWTICWPSALFRTSALVASGGLRPEEEPLGDFAMFMRIARDWDYACVAASLAGFRVHADAATAAVGTFTGTGYNLRENQPRILYAHRRRFIEESRFSRSRADHYLAIADATRRREEVEVIALKAGLGVSWMATSKKLWRLVRTDPRTLLLPVTWRLCFAQLGGRSAKRLLRRAPAWPA
jgi:glycosyltransferase involved in cell wall biosynthesis